MKTKTALMAFSKGQNDPSKQVSSGLAKAASRLVQEHEERESRRMEHAHARAAFVGTGAAFDALRTAVTAANEQALVDSTLPAIMRFDLSRMLTVASEEGSDRGIKHAALLARDLWMRDPTGVASVGEIATLRSHVMDAHRASKLGEVLDRGLSEHGFQTLPVARLSRLARNLMGMDEPSARAAIEAAGIGGSRPEQIRAQAYVRAAAGLEPISVKVAGNLRALGQMLENDVSGIPNELDDMDFVDDDMDAVEPVYADESSEEGFDAVVELESPNTGLPIHVELSQADGPSGPGGMSDTVVQNDTSGGLPDMETMDIVGQLSDFSEMDDTELMSGQESAVVPDPTSLGDDLRITVERLEDEEPDMGDDLDMGDEPLDVTQEMPSNTDMGVSGEDHDSRQAFTVWAYTNGRRGAKPLERLRAPSMGLVLKRIASYGVPGQVACNLSDPGREAVVLVDDQTMLHIVAQDMDSFDDPLRYEESLDGPAYEGTSIALHGIYEYVGEPNGDFSTGERWQVWSLPGYGEVVLRRMSDGHKSPTSDESLTDPDMWEFRGLGTPSDSDTGAMDPKLARTRAGLMSRAAAMGLNAVKIEDQLLSARTVTAGVWSLSMDEDDQVVLVRTDKKTAGHMAWSLIDLDDAVDQFLMRAAAQWKSPAQKAEQHTVAWWKSAGADVAGEGRSNVVALFAHRCAMCGRTEEYAMPSGAVGLACTGCGRVADSQAVARAFSRGAARETGEYIVTVDVPGANERERALNARRIMHALREVDAGVVGARNEFGALEATLRADAAGLNRIERIVSGRYGTRVEAQAVPPAETQQFSQTPPGSPMPPELSLAPGNAAPGAAVGTPGMSGGQSPVTVGAPPAGQPPPPPMGQTAGEDSGRGFMDPTKRVKPPPASRVGQALPLGPPAEAPELGDGPDMGDMPPGDEDLPPPPVEPEVEGGMGGMPMGLSISPDQEEAIRGAMKLYRQSFVGPATAIAKFLSEHGALLDTFGDANTPGRHKAEATLLRIMGDAYSEPAMSMSASVRRALSTCCKCGAECDTDKCGECGHVNTTKDAARSVLKAAFPRVAWDKPKVNTQIPKGKYVKLPSKPLGKDTSGNSAFKAPKVNTQVDTVKNQSGSKAPPKDSIKGNGQGDVSFRNSKPKPTHDPFGNKGTKAPSTKEFPGPDYATGKGGDIAKAIDRASKGAPSSYRSK